MPGKAYVVAEFPGSVWALKGCWRFERLNGEWKEDRWLPVNEKAAEELFDKGLVEIEPELCSGGG